MPVNERFNQFASIKLIVVVGVVHFKIVELKLLIRHLAGVDGNVHVLGDVTKKINTITFYFVSRPSTYAFSS